MPSDDFWGSISSALHTRRRDLLKKKDRQSGRLSRHNQACLDDVLEMLDAIEEGRVTIVPRVA